MGKIRSLGQINRIFRSKKLSVKYFTKTRWPNGLFCPRCGHTHIYKPQKANRPFSCANPKCRFGFSIKAGTIFDNSKLPFKTWFGAIWLATHSPDGVVSTEMASKLKITQKTSWCILNTLKRSVETKSFWADKQ